MDKILNEFIEKLMQLPTYQHLTTHEKEELKIKLKEEFDAEVFNCIYTELNEQKKIEFNQVLDSKDIEKTHEFLIQNCNLEEQIGKFVDSFMRKHLNPNG